MQALRYLMIALIFLVVSCENVQEEPSQNISTQVNPTVATTQPVSLQNTQSSKTPEVFVQLGHSSYVNSVAFSPDGKLALSGSSDKTLKLWEVATGREIRTFKGHSSHVNAVAFSPDGKLALSGSIDNTLKLWEVSTGRELRIFNGHSSSVSAVAFSPDGKLALSGSINTLKTLILWEVSTGRELRIFNGHSSSVESVAFSPDGKLALSGSDDKTMKLWEVTTGREIRTFKGHSTERFVKINSVAFSPSGKFALSGSDDQTMKLWEVATGRELRTFKGHSSYVRSVAFSPDGKLALSGSWDNTMKLWEVSTGREIRTFKGGSSYVNAVAFSPDGKLALSGSYDDTLKLWNVSTGRKLSLFQGYSSRVSSVAFCPSGKLALSGSSWDTLKLWEISTGRELRTFKGHSSYVSSVAFSPDGKLALSGSYDDTLKLWNVSTGRELRTFKGHSSYVSSVAFSPDSKLALSGSNNKIMKLWEVSTGRELRTFKIKNPKSSSGANSVAFSPDSKLALSVGDSYYGFLYLSWNHPIKLWEVSTGRELRSFEGHSSFVNSVAFSPNGKLLLSGSDNRLYYKFDDNLKLWDVSNGREIRTFKGHSSDVSSVAFSPDGKLALSAGGKTIKLWDIATGRNILTFQGHSSDVSSVAFSPDGKLALSGGNDSTTRLWNLQTGKEVVKMVGFYDGEWVTITPEGYYTASLNGAKYINVSIGNEVYSIDQYEALCHKPEIVKLALKLGDSQKAIAQITKAVPTNTCIIQPPKVWIVSPEFGSETESASIEVEVKTENIADSLDAVTFRVNGRPMEIKSAAKAQTKTQSHTQPIPLVVGENWITVQVRGKAGAVEYTEPLLIIRQGGEKPKPDLYYLGIGVAQHPQLPLKYPAKDVKGLETVLKQQEGKVYRRVISKTITDQQATRGNLINVIQTFFKPAKQGDIAILFISGHGMNTTNSGYRFVTYDTDVDNLATTGASWKIFDEAINDLPPQVLLLADTCHSGAITGNSKWKDQSQANKNQFLRTANNNNVVVFSSSSGSSFSMENEEWGHGAFTKALIEGLNGKAVGYKKGLVKLTYLQDYVRERVIELTDGSQTPTIPRFEGSGNFFNLVLAKNK